MRAIRFAQTNHKQFEDCKAKKEAKHNQCHQAVSVEISRCPVFE